MTLFIVVKQSLKRLEIRQISSVVRSAKLVAKNRVDLVAPCSLNSSINHSKNMAKAAPQEENQQRLSMSWFTLPRLLFWAAILVAVSLQARLWLGEGSLAEVWQLRKEIDKQQQENHLLSERNRRLAAEVKDLKQGTSAVEERARAQLGMVKDDETFYLIIDK